MRNNNFGAVTALVFVLFAVTNVATAGENFLQGIWGPTWYQSDSNSNHHAYAQGLEFGHSYDMNLDVVVGYLQSENSDGGVSQDSRNIQEYQHLDYDFDYKAFTVWVMPRAEFGRFTFSAGPGYGAVYSTLDLTMEDGRAANDSSWQDNLSLRADLNYSVTDHFAVGAQYRHDYFEVQLNDRDVSDYEVNQDRVYYMVNARYTF